MFGESGKDGREGVASTFEPTIKDWELVSQCLNAVAEPRFFLNISEHADGERRGGLCRSEGRHRRELSNTQ